MNDNYSIQFEQIKFLNCIGEDLVSFAASKFGDEFFEAADMTCGAMPAGDFEKIVDPSAPEQFIAMYKKIVLGRINYALKNILKLGDSYKKIVLEYFEKAKEPARELNVELKLDEENFILNV